MNSDSSLYHLRRTLRQHERKLVAITLVALVLSGTVFTVVAVVDDVRSAVLDRVEKVITYWDDRWTRRLEYGEALVASGRYAEAAKYLTALDNDFPARHAKHRRDIERERVLRALARSYVGMGRKRLALDTYRRLVIFNPRNFESHYLLATACLQFREPVEAAQHFIRVLAIHPTHLPSVRAYVGGLFEKGDFASVLSAYETYLNAFFTQEVVVSLGDVSAKAHVPVDGLSHEVEVRLTRQRGWSGELTVGTGGYSLEMERVSLEAPVVLGKPGSVITHVWPSKSPWFTKEMRAVATHRFHALGNGATLRLGIPQQIHGITRIRLRLRLFKQFDSGLWKMAETSYRNLLDNNGLARARARSFDGISDGTSH